MKQLRFLHAAPRLPQGQRGVVLIIALVMLITITFAGLALFRQVGLGAVIVGNLAFKQGATSAADRGIERARKTLLDPTLSSIAVLEGTNLSSTIAYYPASCFAKRGDWYGLSTDTSCPNRVEATTPAFNPLTYDWDGTDTEGNVPKSTLATDTSGGTVDSAGNTVRYVVHRMCSMHGSINEVREFTGNVQTIQSCVLAASGRQCLDQGLQFAANCFSQSVQPYYRVTARVQGARNTLSYVEVMLY